MILIENLIDFGLSEKEAKVYVATLELETASANEIAKKSGVNRSSTYVVIESLKKQGLVSVTENKGKIVKQYTATPPEMLLNLAKKRAEKQERIRKMIEELVPSLEALHKDTKHKPKVFVYEGAENVKASYYELSSLNFKDIWRTYEDLAEIDKYLPGFLDKDTIERKKDEVKLCGINPDTKENREIMEINKDTQYNDVNLLIPKNKFRSVSQLINFAVRGDEIIFSSLRQSFSIVIKHQEIADTLKNIFDLAWKEAERIGKKY